MLLHQAPGRPGGLLRTVVLFRNGAGLIDTPAVRMLTRMSDRTLSRRRSDGTIPYVKHGGKIYYSRSRVLEALRNEPNTTSTNKVKKS